MKRCARKLIAGILTIILLVCLMACQTSMPRSGSSTAESSRRPSEESSEKQEASNPPESSGTDDKNPFELNDPETEPVLVEVQRVIVEVINKQVTKGTILSPSVAVFPPEATDKSFTISSGDESVIGMLNGSWTAVGAGTTALIATASNGVTGRVTVTVIVPVQAVSFDEEEITVNIGESITLVTTIRPEDATDQRAVYTSSDERVARVANDGTIHGVGAGTAQIHCTVGGVRTSCTVTVTIPVADVSIITSRLVYKVGDEGRFSIQIDPQDATDQSFTVSISGDSASITGDDTFSCDAGGEVTITVTAANGVTGSQTITIIDLVAYADEVLRLTNIERSNLGLSELGVNPDLTQAAVVRASEIIRSFSHDRPDGRGCFTAYSENNVSYRWAGENIAMGQRSPAEVVLAWMNSPGHRENILKSEFGTLGVGVAIDNDGKLYWSQNFTD